MTNTGLSTRTLGRTGMQVTQLGDGAMELRSAPRGPVVDDADAEQVLRADHVFTRENVVAGVEQSLRRLRTGNLEHLAANLAAARKGPLPPDVYAEARRRLAQPQ